MIDLSIIVPVYNGAEYLSSCIQCIEKQDSEYVEVIIVDDGSTDSSYSLALELKEQYKNIKVITKKNKGLSDTRKVGMEAAQGEYLYFLDVDDIIAENAVKLLIESARKYQADIIAFNSINVKAEIENISNAYELAENQILKSKYIGRSIKKETVYDGLEFVNQSLESEEGFFPPVWLAAYRKDFLEKIDVKFIDIIHEDLVFSIDVCLKAKTIVWLDEIIHFRRIVANSITNGKKSEKHMEGLLYATEFARKLYIQYSSDKRLKKNLRRWNLLNSWQLYTEVRCCNRELKKKYKWKCFFYIIRHPYMGNWKLLVKLALV